MRHYRVIAMYDYPEINRSVQVDAEDPHQAVLRAVLDQRLPVCYERDRNGDLQPQYWPSHVSGQSRWPRIDRNHRLIWEVREQLRQLRFEVEEIADPV